MSRPAVLLVEDDASLRRFVAMALEELEVELVACASVPQALQALEQRRFSLVLTDLMLPQVSGFDLLQRLVAEPALRGAARVAVLSAGLDAAARQRLQGLGVWRILAKPVALRQLEDCVNEAVQAAAPAAAPPLPAPGLPGPIARHFAGNAALFAEFAEACALQFRLDVEAGDAALAHGDWPALRRLSHSLKTVLETLGRDAAAQTARELERHCAAGDAAASVALWPALRAALLAQADRGGA